MSNINLHKNTGEVYSMQHYVIKFVSDFWQVGGFLRFLKFVSDLQQVGGFLYVIKFVSDLQQVGGFFMW